MAKGFTQVEGIDFHEVFSLVVKHSSIRTLLAIVAMEGLELHQLDVKIAFLHGESEEEIFIKQPNGTRNLIPLCFHMILQGAPMIVVSILKSLIVGLLYF